MGQAKKKPHKLKTRIISGFTTLLLLFAVVGCLYIVLQSLSKGYVEFGGTSLFRVVTGSMEPAIPVGSVLVARDTDIEQIDVDDMVCFHSRIPGSSGVVVTHRVVGIYTDSDGTLCLRTKGDANLSVDAEPVTQDNLIGRVIWHTGDGSKMAGIVAFLTSDYGFLACIVLPVILVAVWIFRDAAKNIRKEIRLVEEQLEQQEKEKKEKEAAVAAAQSAEESAPLSQEEYEQLYAQIADELRKEMEQNAEASEQNVSEVAHEPADQDAQPADEADAEVAFAPSDEGEPVQE